MTFFSDRGLGSKLLPKALRDAGWVLETMDERYGSPTSMRVSDTQWIAEASSRGNVLLTKDLAVARNPLEAQAIWAYQARVFGLSNANIGMPDMAEWFLSQEERIVEMALRASGPYVVAVSGQAGLRRVRLAHP